MATIRHRGGNWQVQVRRRGMAALSRTFAKRQDAVVWARQAEAQADEGSLEGRSTSLSSLRLRDLVERYRDTVSVQKRGHEVEKIVLNAFLRHRICDRKLSLLSAPDFAFYRDERLKSVRANTLKREFSTLHNLFEIARHEWGFPLHGNPVAKMGLPRNTVRRERRLRDGEFKRLMAAGNQCRAAPMGLIIRWALETAMRRGEIVAMRRSCLDEGKRTLVIPETKNGHARIIPLSLEALRILRSLPPTGDLVFSLTANALRLSWQRLKRRAGIKDLRFHDLRHEAISRLFEKGLSVPEVALISGHRDMRGGPGF